MTRKIKGFKFLGRYQDAFEEHKAVKLYINLYENANIKVLNMINKFGKAYTDIYLKDGAKPIKKLIHAWGLTMTFKDIKTGLVSGDKTLIKRG